METEMDDETAHFWEVIENTKNATIPILAHIKLQKDTIAMHQELLARMKYSEIAAITYSMLTFEQQKGRAACQITRPLKDGDDNSVNGTVNSSTLSNNYGIIILNAPVYHPTAITYLPKVMQFFCLHCGLAKFPYDAVFDTNNNEKLTNHWNLMMAQVETSDICYECNNKHDKLVHPNQKNASTIIAFQSKQSESNAGIKASTMLNIMRSIHPWWAAGKLGFGKNEMESTDDLPQRTINQEKIRLQNNELLIASFILQGIMVPPIEARPKQPGGPKNPMTDALDLVVRKNAKIKRDEKPEQLMEYGCVDHLTEDSNQNELFIAISDLMNSGNVVRTMKKKAIMKTILDKKEGLIRGHLARKRNNFSARTVMSPAPMNEPDELSVPRIWESEMTPRVRVTQYNQSYLSKLQRDGKLVEIFNYNHSTGVYQQVHGNDKKTYKLVAGDEVYRFLQNGDLCNPVRNPTLQVQGMLSMRVKLWDQDTIGIAPSTYSGWAGDFDGDTMSFFLTQEPLAKVEGMMLNNVSSNYFSRVNGAAMNGPNADSPKAMYIMTTMEELDAHVFDKCLALLVGEPQMQSYNRRVLLARNKFGQQIPIHSGRALFSATLPALLNYQDGSGDKEIIIENGILVDGYIRQPQIESGGKCLIRWINHFYGEVEIMRWVNAVSQMANVFMSYHGPSVGYQDLVMSLPVTEGVTTQQKIMGELYKIIEELESSGTNPHLLEKKIIAAIELHHFKLDVIVQKAIENSPYLTMARDSEGGGVSKLVRNMMAMIGWKGQGWVEEKLPAKTMTYGLRASSYSSPGNPTELPGHSSHSLAQGEHPIGFKSASLTARKSLIDQNCTSAPGSLGLRIERAMDNLVTNDMGCTIWMDGRIVQYRYGGDNLSTMECFQTYSKNTLFRSPFDFKALSNNILRERGYRTTAAQVTPNVLMQQVADTVAAQNRHRVSASKTGEIPAHLLDNRGFGIQSHISSHIPPDTVKYALRVLQQNNRGVMSYRQTILRKRIPVSLYQFFFTKMFLNGYTLEQISAYVYAHDSQERLSVLSDNPALIAQIILLVLWYWENIVHDERIQNECPFNAEQFLLFLCIEIMRFPDTAVWVSHTNPLEITADTFISSFEPDEIQQVQVPNIEFNNRHTSTEQVHSIAFKQHISTLNTEVNDSMQSLGNLSHTAAHAIMTRYISYHEVTSKIGDIYYLLINLGIENHDVEIMQLLDTRVKYNESAGVDITELYNKCNVLLKSNEDRAKVLLQKQKMDTAKNIQLTSASLSEDLKSKVTSFMYALHKQFQPNACAWLPKGSGNRPEYKRIYNIVAPLVFQFDRFQINNPLNAKEKLAIIYQQDQNNVRSDLQLVLAKIDPRLSTLLNDQKTQNIPPPVNIKMTKLSDSFQLHYYLELNVLPELHRLVSEFGNEEYNVNNYNEDDALHEMRSLINRVDSGEFRQKPDDPLYLVYRQMENSYLLLKARTQLTYNVLFFYIATNVAHISTIITEAILNGNQPNGVIIDIAKKVCAQVENVLTEWYIQQRKSPMRVLTSNCIVSNSGNSLNMGSQLYFAHYLFVLFKFHTTEYPQFAAINQTYWMLHTETQNKRTFM